MVASVLCVPLLLGGCGDEPGGRAAGSPSASTSTSACPLDQSAVRVAVSADLDGDGSAETVDYANTPTCPGGPTLRAEVAGKQVSAPIGDDTSLREGEIWAVQIPGRTGDLVLVKQQHPRGGFQARLFGYADGRFEQLTAEGKPVFGFIATDVMTNPTAVTCTDGGFTATQARAHEPIGVVPAWDIDRTTYTVDGNTVTKGATSEVADNVLDRQLQRDPSNLVNYPFFENCLVRR